MAYRFSDLTLTTLSDLVVTFTKYTLDTDEYDYFFAKALTALQNCSPNYASKDDINKRIDGLSEKYGFHGFLKQGHELQSLVATFLGNKGGKVDSEEFQTRLNVLKFVLEMSTRPTNRLASQENTPMASNVKIDEENINWTEYLMEGIEPWNPPADDSSEYSEEDEDLFDPKLDPIYKNLNFNGDTSASNNCSSVEFFVGKNHAEYNRKKSFMGLKETYEPLIQHSWYNTNKIIRHLPESEHEEATTALQWERCMEILTGGLLVTSGLNIISEYKVMRELIFELYMSHENMTFNYDGIVVDVKDNITISSSRPEVFQNFLMQQFVPYINTLHAIEIFCKNVMFNPKAPDTYRSFCNAANEVCLLTLKDIGAIEKIIQKQEETYTLIRLAAEFPKIFEKVTILKRIIDQLPDFLENPVGYCATYLLNILLKMLHNCTTKLEQDVTIFLLLESLTKHMTVIDNWLGQDDFQDCRDELPNFSYFNTIQKSGWLFDILIKEVDKLSKNVHLLKRFRKLGKLKPNQTPGYISLHEELIENVVKEIAGYSGVEIKDEVKILARKVNYPETFNPDVFKFSNDEETDNLPDMSDRFLISAFKEFFLEDESSENESLYEKISGITKGLVCTYGLIENALLETLKSRYGESGNMVRDTLRNEYRILDHIKMMNHLYLFKDGIIFDFFKKLSKKINNIQNSFNPINLTLMLQDILMDIHPDFFENVSVNVKAWEECGDDILGILSKINVNYKMDWPLNSIITDGQVKLYKEIFTLILQIKWSVYTLSNSQLSDNKVRNLKGNTKYLSILKRRLQILRFSLLNTMSYIQHFIFGSVFFKSSIQLEREWNVAGNGEEFRQAHEHYITEMHSSCAKLNNFNSSVKANNVGFYELLVTVNKLRLMEINLWNVQDQELVECENSAKLAHKTITSIIYDMQYNQIT